MSGDSLILTLLRDNGRGGFQEIKNVMLHGTNKSLLQFSKSGEFFALYDLDTNSLSLYDSSEIMECFE